MATKIVLVEPDKEQREQFLNAVKGSGFEVCHVSDTNAEAVDLYESIRPQLLVLRVVSGKLGAGAALDVLRKKNRQVKAAVSYDVRSTHLLMDAYSHGAASAIKRPFHMHRVVEKLTFAVASERRDSLVGPIVRLGHPFQVRYKSGAFLARSRMGFCERLGLTDMDLNTDAKPPKAKSQLRLELQLPPPAGMMRFVGVVEEIEDTRPDNRRLYIALKNVSEAEQAVIEAFIVTAARKV